MINHRTLLLTLSLVLQSSLSFSEPLSIEYLYADGRKTKKTVELSSERLSKLQHTISEFLESSCIAKDGDCPDTPGSQTSREDYIEDGQYFISLRNPANRLFYFSKALPLMYGNKRSDPMSAAYFSRGFEKHVEVCEDLVQENSRDQFKEWVKAISDVREYLPLLAELGMNLTRLYDHTHFISLGRSNIENLTYFYPVYALTPEEKRPSSIVSTYFTNWMKDLNVTSPRFVRLPIETLAESKKTTISLKLDSPEESFYVFSDITEQLIYTIHRTFFRDWHRYPLPIFVGFIDPEIADSYASSGGFFDHDILGGQFVHGYFSHVLQLAQLKQHHFPQKDLLKINHRCWGSLFEKNNLKLWHSAVRLRLPDNINVIFYNPVLGNSPDTLQELLSQRFFSDLINSAITSKNPELVSYLFSTLKINSMRELIAIKNALRALENAIIEHNYKSWHQPRGSLSTSEEANEFVTENSIQMSEKQLSSAFNNEMMAAPRTSLLQTLDTSRYSVLHLNPANTFCLSTGQLAH